MKITIQYQDQFGRWKHYQVLHNEQNAFRTAANRASRTGSRHRLVDSQGSVLDIVEP